MGLAEFNAAPVEKADSVGAAVVTGRPYAAVGDLVAAGRRAAAGMTAEAGLSRGERAGLATSGPRERLLEGNRADEERFGRVFLTGAGTP